ncbi:MAG: tripartite tricarboxylate transporter TctB family protein [Enterocloster asparagiformis]|nr:tripartite tricarboxylate transporter TctB family protein [Enterocloster asparagiformis]
MALELLLNAVLTVFFAYCIFYIQGSTPPNVTGEVSGRQWSTVLLVLLVIVLIANMIQIYRSTPQEKRNLKSITDLRPDKIFKSKLFWGMAVLIVYSLTLDYIGFLLGSFIFCMIFTYLLGEKKIVSRVVFSFVAVIVLYLIFYKGFGIMLPRGKGFLRTFALSVEALLRHIF